MSQLNDQKSSGKVLWRSLGELADTPEFREQVEREFPEGASEVDGVTRRGFMKVMAAGMGLAGMGLSSCRRPEFKALAYNDMPEGIIPGKANFYTTTLPRVNGSIGLLVKSFEGRPTKIEGFDKHPANKGKSDYQAQAELLDLYDPYRVKQVLFAGDANFGYETAKDGHGQASEHETDGLRVMNATYRAEIAQSWKKLKAALKTSGEAYSANGGEGMALLLEPTVSPTEERTLAEVTAKFPKAQVYYWNPLHSDNTAKAISAFSGQDGNQFQLNYDLSKADIVVDVDADFMIKGDDHLKLLRDYSDKRRVFIAKDDDNAAKEAEMNRLYVVEPGFTVTGSNADHRLRLQAVATKHMMLKLAQEVAKLKGDSDLTALVSGIETTYNFAGTKLNKEGDKTGADFVTELAKDLVAKSKHGKFSAIIVGKRQSVEAQLLGLALNKALGNISATVSFSDKAAKNGKQSCTESVSLLQKDIAANKIQDLFIVGGNPAYDAPADIKLADAITKVKNSWHLTYHFNETSALAKTVIPSAHFLESWGDARAWDGTVSTIQPLIAPLFGAWTNSEFFAHVADSKTLKARKQLAETNNGISGKAWEKMIHDSVLPASAFASKALKLNQSTAKEVLKPAAFTAVADGWEIVFEADYSMGAGRSNGNGWLQEFPDPITKITWDNAALVSMATQKELNVETGGLIKIGDVEIALQAIPGIADKTIILPLGYGRTVTTPVGEKSGFDVYPLRTSEAQGFKATTQPAIVTDKPLYELAGTQDHWAMEGRDLVKDADLADLKEHTVAEAANLNGFDVVADRIEHEKKHGFDKVPYETNKINQSIVEDRAEWIKEGSYQWAMSIDLNNCIGCGTCTIACQAENNISVVGKAQVLKGREMHWIRMDRYFFAKYDGDGGVFKGDEDKVRTKEQEDAKDMAAYDTAVEGIYHQPIPCMQCEKAPCELVCPVAATPHSSEGLNDMTYNRCIGTRYCANNCPYKVRRFNFFQNQEDFKNPAFEVKKMVYNPNVTVRSRGVMEKCTYCVQRINTARGEAKASQVIDGRVADDKNAGRIVTDSFTTACAQACPTSAITFGDIHNHDSAIVKMKLEQRNYALLPELNARPRTSFLAKLRNQNPELKVKTATKGGH